MNCQQVRVSRAFFLSEVTSLIRFLYSRHLDEYPILKNEMFRDRALQFHQRLRWDVHVDMHGEEHDEYDRMDPLYIIVESPDGRHEGSMRLMPTMGATMVNDHFLYLNDG